MVPRLVVTVTMRPRLLRIMIGATARAIMSGAVALTARKRLQCSGEICQKRSGSLRKSGRIEPWPMPALLTRMSIRPAWPSTVDLIVSAALASLKSARTGIRLPVAFAAVAAPLSSSSHAASLSTAATSMPAFNNPSVIARPMPLAAPVTIATWRSPAMASSFGCRLNRVSQARAAPSMLDYRSPEQGSAMADTNPEIDRHYGRGGLLERLLAALRAAGKDVERLTIDDLQLVDEFHSRRRLATEELARLLASEPGARVLDVGSGLGGPARYLAQVHGCRVSGIDATAEFVAVATELARRTGLADRVDFRHAAAPALPFPDARFDLAWTQNVAMNIADRPRFYAELARVLKPGGRLALQDVTQGAGGPVLYPVPWADTPALSYLRTAAETRALFEQAGFT